MFFALNLLLDVDVEDGVRTGDFGVLVQLDARRAEQLGTVETLGRRFAVFSVYHLADITERILRCTLSTNHLQTTQQQITFIYTASPLPHMPSERRYRYRQRRRTAKAATQARDHGLLPVAIQPHV